MENEFVEQEEFELEEEIAEEGYNEIPKNEEGKELLYPGGPTLEKVEEWKSLFTDLYFTEFEEDAFVWRCLKRYEYKEITKVQGADTFYKEERICERCILWPEEYSFTSMKDGKAGVPTFLAEQIMEKSGFTATVPSFKL